MAPAWFGSVRWVFCASAFFLLIGFASGTAQAQVNTGKVSFTTGVDFSHAYFFRGITQEREGFITQPYADINFNVYADDDGEGLNGVTFTLGMWNSFHTVDGPAANVRAWYESDFFTGFTLAIDNWDAGITYTSYLSPNQAFGTTQELSLGLSMDDSDMLGVFAMSPHVLLAIELSGGADGGSSEGVYLELGVEPGMDIFEGVASVGFPMTVGLSLSNYYENGIDSADHPLGFSDNFGFFDIGAAVSVPLNVPAAYGDWEVSGGVHLLSLGSYLEFLNDNDQVQVIGSFGFSIGY